MTTTVSIINNGPGKVRVGSINLQGALGVGTVTLAPSERHDVLVYDGQDVQVHEVQERDLRSGEQQDPAGGATQAATGSGGQERGVAGEGEGSGAESTTTTQD